jgi:hypothetical protein
MAETETPDFESRLAALEKSVASIEKGQTVNSRKLLAVHRDVSTALDYGTKTSAMLGEILELTRRAAPLLDSPMARMAQTPAGAGVLSLLTKGRSRG